MTTTARRILIGFGTALFIFTLQAAAQQRMPQTTKESVAGSSTVTTEELKGTVILVEGNHLAVRMSSGEIRTFDVPDYRRFIIDGKQLTVGELKPGTKLSATVTTTTTSVTDRTRTVGTGKVWYVAGNTVIITLPNNENRQYKVDENYRFNVEGKKASVHELRKGMVIAAEKIVEEPRVEIASNTTVTGQAPPAPKPRMAEAAPLPAAAPAPVPEKPVEVAPPTPPVATPSAERTAETPTQELPATASELPLIAVLGVLSIAVGILSRRLRRL